MLARILIIKNLLIVAPPPSSSIPKYDNILPLMACGETCPPKKKCVRHGIHYQMELNLSSEADKKNFLWQLELVKSVMSSLESRPLDNREILGLLLDMAGVGDDGGNDTVNESSGGPQRDIVIPMLKYSGNT